MYFKIKMKNKMHAACMVHYIKKQNVVGTYVNRYKSADIGSCSDIDSTLVKENLIEVYIYPKQPCHNRLKLLDMTIYFNVIN